MPQPKPTGKAGNEKRKVAHYDILTGSHHYLQLEAREAVTHKTNYQSVPEAYKATTKKPKRKRSFTNSYTKPQVTKIVKQLRMTPSDDVNGATENPMCQYRHEWYIYIYIYIYIYMDMHLNNCKLRC